MLGGFFLKFLGEGSFVLSFKKWGRWFDGIRIEGVRDRGLGSYLGECIF